MPSHNPILKIHVLILLMYNLDVDEGHYNGTRYVILEVMSNYTITQKLNGIKCDLILILKILCTSNTTYLEFFHKIEISTMLSY